MASLRRSISSLGALSTFEAAARLGGFTLAAAELGVTQAAVSRQIKLLETELNTPLFLRAHRKVELTPAGQALAATVTAAFGHIAEVLETLRKPLVPDTVTIGATLAFSHFWLLPRLSEFRTLHPEIKLKLVADDMTTDMRRDHLDMAIRYGKLPYDDATCIATTTGQVFPVCSPRLLERLGLPADTADLARMPLIASDWVNPSWLTWRAWAREAGLGPDLGRAADMSRLRFSHYTDTIQAAENGEGVALGWSTLLERPLAEGRLVRVGARSARIEEGHHLLVPVGRQTSPAARSFLDWVAGHFAQDA